jgi:hypothetical protein
MLSALLLLLLPHAFCTAAAAACCLCCCCWCCSCRLAWRSWLMAPSHVVLVVEAAWLLLALVLKQDELCAAALQVRPLLGRG